MQLHTVKANETLVLNGQCYHGAQDVPLACVQVPAGAKPCPARPAIVDRSDGCCGSTAAADGDVGVTVEQVTEIASQEATQCMAELKAEIEALKEAA